MFKKILVILCLVVVCAIFSGYFYCAGRYSASQTALERCNNIDVIITNPQQQNFIGEGEVADLVRNVVMGKQIESINTYALEERLCASSAICQEHSAACCGESANCPRESKTFLAAFSCDLKKGVLQKAPEKNKGTGLPRKRVGRCLCLW